MQYLLLSYKVLVQYVIENCVKFMFTCFVLFYFYIRMRVTGSLIIRNSVTKRVFCKILISVLCVCKFYNYLFFLIFDTFYNEIRRLIDQIRSNLLLLLNYFPKCFQEFYLYGCQWKVNRSETSYQCKVESSCGGRYVSVTKNCKIEFWTSCLALNSLQFDFLIQTISPHKSKYII